MSLVSLSGVWKIFLIRGRSACRYVECLMLYASARPQRWTNVQILVGFQCGIKDIYPLPPFGSFWHLPYAIFPLPPPLTPCSLLLVCLNVIHMIDLIALYCCGCNGDRMHKRWPSQWAYHIWNAPARLEKMWRRYSIFWWKKSRRMMVCSTNRRRMDARFCNGNSCTMCVEVGDERILCTYCTPRTIPLSHFLRT